MDRIFQINGRSIGEGLPAYVIAEIGINHNGQVETAKELIDRAKWAGADAVKLQTYITEKRVQNDSPVYKVLKQCEMTFDQQRDLFGYAMEKQIDIFSTPFDDESVDFLASVNIPCYKIASFDVVNSKLLRKVSGQGRPVIMSRGMATQEEIDRAVETFKAHDISFALLHCISAYPVSSLRNVNLRTIRALKERYHCTSGFSDHTLGIEAAKYAVAAGASIIEKHFTLSRKSEGPDHPISAEPQDMKSLVDSVRFVQEIMGEEVWSSTGPESAILQYRRHS